LASYKFNWDDYPSDEVQILHQDLFGRLTDDLLKTHIERARRDLRDFQVTGPSTQKRKQTRLKKDQGVGPKLEKMSPVRILIERLERITL
jgi:hypothetical protein